MKKLLKKLKKNYKKEFDLSVEFDIVKNGIYWNQSWIKPTKKENELLRIKSLLQKNLSNRFSILESLELEIIKAKQDTSTKQKNINL